MTSLSSSTATMHLSDDGDASPKIPTKEEFLGMTVKQLKQILKERNVDCIGCSEKSHLVERVLETYHLPIVPPEEPKPAPEPKAETDFDYNEIMDMFKKKGEWGKNQIYEEK